MYLHLPRSQNYYTNTCISEVIQHYSYKGRTNRHCRILGLLATRGEEGMLWGVKSQ